MPYGQVMNAVILLLRHDKHHVKIITQQTGSVHIHLGDGAESNWNYRSAAVWNVTQFLPSYRLYIPSLILFARYKFSSLQMQNATLPR